MFNPGAAQLTTAIRLQHRKTTKVNGQHKNEYQDAEIPVRLCEFKPFFGSESLQAGTMGISDGGTLTMWYTPDVKPSDRILLNDDPQLIYDVLAAENVGNRGVWLILKIKRAVSA